MAAATAEIAVNDGLRLEPLAGEQIVAGSAKPGIGARGGLTRYPFLQVYCDRLVNQQREKFRSFSGSARIVIELWTSEERAEEMEQRLYAYVEAVTRVLERNRGDWGQGVSYGGAYEVRFGEIKSGGRNYTQSAKVLAEVHVSQP